MTAHGTIIEYDIRKYDFRTWAASVLDFEQLENIHTRADLQAYTNIVDQINACRRLLIQGFECFRPVYVHFIQSVIGPMFDGVNSYQVPPSFRFHFSQKGSSSFHRDRDYGVNPAHLNVWVPFMRVWGANSIWIESQEGKGDFSPVNLEYGQALIFDGPNLCHGSVWNDTPSSRVSMDFRFSPRNVQTEKSHPCPARFPADV
ncbi:MAG: hypothetical protein KGM95_03805 [Betaproteobacteria bacterium]|nr:hypothetical protein [Betaproteobacteria bacterium]